MSRQSRILVVDDDPGARALLVAVLEEAGHEVLTTDDGATALEAATREAPDLILLDVVMPGRDGLDICTSLKAREETAPIPVIFVTAASETDHILNGFSVGGCDYVVKPFTSLELLARVSVQLRLRWAERALRESEERFRSVIAACKDAMIAIDRNARIILFNSAAEDMFGRSATEMLGRRIDCLMPENLRERHDRAIKDFLAREEWTGTIDRTAEFPAVRSDGHEFPIELSISAGQSSNQRFVLGVVRDISQRKQHEEELRTATDQADRARQEVEQINVQLLQSAKLASIGQLAAGVAHEINNPIGFISSNLHSLGEYAEDLKRVLAAYDELLTECRDGHSNLNAKVAEVSQIRNESDLDFIVSDVDNLIEESVEGTQRVRRIVADLRDFSHVDSPEVNEENINELLDKTINVAWNELKYKAEVVREYGEVPTIRCYGGRLGQVFLNLLVNAAHAIEEHGTITIRTGRDRDNAWIELEDTGCGMPDEVIDHIFDAFFTTKEVGKGTGMGLHLASNIIDAHGGFIDCKSTVGKGTTFRIELPVDGPPTATATSRENSA